MRIFTSTTPSKNDNAANVLARSRSSQENAPASDTSASSAQPIFHKASCSCGGGCPACQAKSNNLKVSQPNDPAEIEADQIADKVMGMAEPSVQHHSSPSHNAGEGQMVQRKPLASTITPLIQRQPPEQAEDKETTEVGIGIQRFASGDGEDGGDPYDFLISLGSGSPLDLQTRSFFEPRFGADFGHVRIHAGAQAENSARAVNALAYTSGRDVVFGAGQYQPGTDKGKSLLAHELTHVVQQEADAVRPAGGLRLISAPGHSIQRQPAGSRGPTSPRPPHITQVVVNQTTPQQVTATFSDGRSESGEISTGKGHCCFDDSAGTAEGGACSAARSRQVGNNCTPVGDFTVTARVPVTGGGVRLWTQFHDAKQVALHEYSPVDGTPLSHGCVRMHTAMAQTIFDGSRVGVTRIKVEGLARPMCDHPTLQSEWSDDFTLAGSTPPDGQTIDPFSGERLTWAEIARERRHIRGAREEMRSALGTDDAGLDVELAAVQGGAPIVSKIPRCIPALTVEEQQVSSAQSSGFLRSGAASTSTAFSTALNRTRSAAGAERVVRQAGEHLWLDETASARSGGAGTDDRQLYWTRLMMTTALRAWNPSWVPNADTLRRQHTRLLQMFEQTSRGMTATAFPTDNPDLKRILISGFDPFGFPSGGDIRQSNLSGAAAIALDGVTLAQGSVSARVEAVVFPVRYADFNEGIVENHLRPHLTGSNPPHLVMSISQGSTQFEFEESAGRRRSRDTFLENLGRPSGGTPTNPTEPPGLATGSEFLPHSVPPAMLGAMRGAEGRTAAIPEETTVQDLPTGATQPRILPGGPGSNPGLAVEGSGGGFLSNEIYYRNSLLRTQTGSNVPMIHLHTPRLAPGATDTDRNALITKIRAILVVALPNL